ncbi:MAG: hypothetical protein ACLFWF_02765 [Alphaproteobacteria bacterium]
MSVKTVRMEPEDEALLERIRRRTGWTASDVLKRGLRSLERDMSSKPATRAFEIYTSLDLGSGGYAAGPASRSRETARKVIRRKHKQ